MAQKKSKIYIKDLAVPNFVGAEILRPIVAIL